MYDVSFYTAMNAHVDLHCQVLPIPCCDMRIPALALRQGFPGNWLAYNVFTNITNWIIITGPPETRKRQVLLHFINYFLVVYTFVIDCDVLIRRIWETLFYVSVKTYWTNGRIWETV